MESSNGSARDLIATLVRTCMLLIACALLYMIYNCMIPCQRSDDPNRRPEEEGRIRQGCYPWDDEYSDGENDEEEDEGGSFTGSNQGTPSGKDYQNEPGSIKEGQVMDEKVPMLKDRLFTSDYGSVSGLKKSLTATR